MYSSGKLGLKKKAEGAKMPFAPSAFTRWSFQLELQSPTHRDNTGALLWAGRLSEVGVADRAVHAEVRPIEQVEDVGAIDKPNTTVPIQLELFNNRDVLREDWRIPKSADELRRAPKLELAGDAEGR
jgi:hypothetical protein